MSGVLHLRDEEALGVLEADDWRTAVGGGGVADSPRAVAVDLGAAHRRSEALSGATVLRQCATRARPSSSSI